MITIDLRSDTLTRINKEDLNNINYNYISDDCYNEDIYVKELESYISQLFNKESALFMPSGTMSNQIGLKVLSSLGDEVITEVGYHICFFESAQTSILSGLIINNVKTKNGILTEKDVIQAINNKARWSNLYASPKIIAIESSISTYGGITFPLAEIKKLKQLCIEKNMSLFLDGARVLNSCISLGIPPQEYVKDVDLLNICLSKGIGAPFGSVLVGEKHHIEKAKRFRKWYGGALHQSGLLAAIALNKLEHYESRLRTDHKNAVHLASIASKYFQLAYPVETNIVMVKTQDANNLVHSLKSHGILSTAWTSDIVRFVTSSNISESMIMQIDSLFQKIEFF
ncbi:L-allo-threonine aldolase [Providencia rustigianii]|uniref:L-allo-threonine aldolase n=1 Tax=Providencia rustigianii TaxID=158850 RepID=A0A379G6Z3_9GAMM|nr:MULTISPECIES: GntG family PLP-dependent aldolase [Providencia]MTC56521.1 aminotransferase class I/II-fold pyridoxal phosphate-dependent enzyme [Providencia rustigianii]SUC36814.1 L-allo-threonine aldolase [Providencia rustigianii]VEB75089.1 L-allo-threonine aldolase [Providencia rustigianii]